MKEYVTDEQYAQQMKKQYKQRKLRETVKNNQKSQRGFGYNYKPIQFDYPSNDE